MISVGVSPACEVVVPGWGECGGIQFAAMRGHASIVRFLIENQPNICTRNNRPYHIERPMAVALRYGHLECVEALFNLGGFTDYQWASRLINGAVPHVAMIRLLVSLGINLNLLCPKEEISLGEEALLDAVERGREPVVRVLLELGVSPNSPNQKTHPVLRAKVYDKGEVLETLLEFGGNDINVLDSVYAADCEAGKTPYPQKIGGGRGIVTQKDGVVGIFKPSKSS